MLGLADRGRVLDLFERSWPATPGGALAELAAQYAAGADPLAVLRDLAEVTHWVSMVQLAPEAADDPTVGPDERARGLDFAGAAADAGADPGVADAAEGARGGGDGAERDDGGGDGGDPADPCRRPAEPGGAGPPAERGAAAGAAAGAGRRAAARRAARGRRPLAAARGRRRRRRRRRRARSPARSPATPLRGRGGAGARPPRREPARRDRARPAPGALRARPHRVRAGRRRAARPRGAAGAAAAALDRRALGRGGGRLRRRARPSPRFARASTATCRPARAAHPMVQAVLAAFPGAEIREVRPADALAAAAPAAGRRRATKTTTGIRSIPISKRRANAQGSGTAWRHGQDHEAGAGDAVAHGRRAEPARRDRGRRRGRAPGWSR